MADKNKNNAPLEDEMEPDLMTLMDEDGVEVTFEVVDNLEYNNEHYLAAVEYIDDEEDLDEDGQVIFLKISEDEEGEYLDIVEDDEELLAISKIFEKRLEGMYEIQA